MMTAASYPALARRRVLFLDGGGHCIYPPGVAVVPPPQLDEFHASTAALLQQQGRHGSLGSEDPYLASYSCPISVTLRPLSGKRRLQESQQHHHQQELAASPYSRQSPQSQWHASSSSSTGISPGGHLLTPPAKRESRGGLINLLNSDSDVSLPPSDAEGHGSQADRGPDQDTLEGLAFWLNSRLWMVAAEVPAQKDLAPDSQWHQIQEFIKSAAGQALFDPCDSAVGPPDGARRVFMLRVSDDAILNAASERANHYHHPGDTLPPIGVLLENARASVVSNAIFNAFKTAGAAVRAMHCCDGRVGRADFEANAAAANAAAAGSHVVPVSLIGKTAIFCPCRLPRASKDEEPCGPYYLFYFLQDEYLLIEWRGVSRTSPAQDFALPAPAPAQRPAMQAALPPHARVAAAGSSGAAGGAAWGVFETRPAPHGKDSVARAAARRLALHGAPPAGTSAAQVRKDPHGGPHPRAGPRAGGSAGASSAARGSAAKAKTARGGEGGGSGAAQKRRVPTGVRRASSHRTPVTSMCDECGATESCVWRQDPQIPTRRLCNACGLRVSRYQRKIRRLDAMIAATNAASAQAASAATPEVPPEEPVHG